MSGLNQYGEGDYSIATAFITGDLISGMEATQRIPTEFGLSQNYPNPFNPTTSFEFGVSSFEFVSLKVLDGLEERLQRS